jgi:hypothetical protein
MTAQHQTGGELEWNCDGILALLTDEVHTVAINKAQLKL